MSRPYSLIAGPSMAREFRRHRRSIDGLLQRAGGQWIYVGTVGLDGIDALLTAVSPPFQNGWANPGPPDVEARFRWKLGGGIDWEGMPVGGTAGTTIFTLPLGFYDPRVNVPLSGHDASGLYRAFHIVGATGDLVDGP